MANSKKVLLVVLVILACSVVAMAQADPMTSSMTVINNIFTGTWARMAAGVLALVTGFHAYQNRQDLSHHIPAIIGAVLGLTWMIFANQIIGVL